MLVLNNNQDIQTTTKERSLCDNYSKVKNKDDMNLIFRRSKFYQEDIEEIGEENFQELTEFKSHDIESSNQKIEPLKLTEENPDGTVKSSNSHDQDPGSEFYYSCIERFYRDHNESHEKDSKSLSQRFAETLSQLSRTTLMDEIDYDLDGMKINEASSK